MTPAGTSNELDVQNGWEHCSPWLRPPRRFSPPPLRRSGGKRQPLPRPISRLVSPMLHCSPWLRPPRVLTPPAPPVALGATNGRTTPRSYAKLTKTLISTRKTSAFKTKTLISTPKTTISTPESIMPTSLYLQPRGFREIRLPSFYSLSLRLALAVSTPVMSSRKSRTRCRACCYT